MLFVGHHVSRRARCTEPRRVDDRTPALQDLVERAHLKHRFDRIRREVADDAQRVLLGLRAIKASCCAS